MKKNKGNLYKNFSVKPISKIEKINEKGKAKIKASLKAYKGLFFLFTSQFLTKEEVLFL